ncbi:MAG: restriction endonuclease subunit S [Candidatus Contendobacter sp.]|nr:restriction endonuclease subunit S [Candidatus Contendobacter sp.]
MNAQMLLENFRHIANAPGGVKRLREMILHYAVSGKLVAQIDSDGNAEQDIERVNFLREEFQHRFKIRNRKPIESPRNEEIPFSIPKNWKWTRMESIACYIQRGKGPMYAASGQALVVSQKCIQWSGFDLTPARRISDESLRQYGEERFLIKGDILWNSTGTGTAGRVAIYPGSQEPAVADSHVTIIRLANFIPQYVWCYLASPIIQARMAPNQESSMVSGTTNQVELSTSKVVELPVPCPPIEEQKRIVAKVDELMALCDKLEAQQQERERRFPVLSRACHARFVESPSLANLKAIFDEAEIVSTDDLRKTVLDLACLGKLVPQSNFNSTGKYLVEKIQAKRVELQNFGKISRRKPCRSWNYDEVPFNIPTSWTWTMLGEATDIGTGSTPSKDNSRFWLNGTIPWIASGSTSYSRILAGDELVTEEAVIAHRLRIYSPGTLLVALYGQGKTRGQVSTLEINATINQALAAICPIEGYEEMQDFLKILLLRNYDEIRSQSAGGAQPNLNVQKIKEMFIPLPPLAEQRRIVAKVDQLMALIDKLEEQQARKAKVAQAFAQAAVSAITGTEIKEPEKMKAPKTELVSRLQTRNKPNAADPAPLAKLLTDHNGELPAKALWQRSGLEIDAFYQQLRTEMANGWIIEPEKAVMKEIEAD